MEYERETAQARAPAERIHDFAEFQLALPEGTLRRQAARCMDCGIPFCQAGVLIGGMASGCPINNLIPEWNHLVYTGRWHEAYLRLSKTNDFPEFTGRVCPAPCEGSCTVGINSGPVTVKKIELEIVERAWEAGWVVPEPPPIRTGRRVAVVGSGPAGLSCAAQLNRAGHHVTVYERAERAGGLLMYGIPAMKLAKEVVERRLALLAEEGIMFRTGVEVGRDLDAAQLRAENDAVVLCTGAAQPRDLAVEGRQLAGVHFAVDFLRLSTQWSLQDAGPGNSDEGHAGPRAAVGNSNEGTGTEGMPRVQGTGLAPYPCSRRPGSSSAPRYLSARGKDVIVIGGGDTGTDCVASCLRQGCRSIRQFEILPRPPDARPPDNPWPEWPRTYRVDYGQEEAAAIFGRDPREYGILASRLDGDAAGHVQAIHTVRVEPAGRAGAGKVGPDAGLGAGSRQGGTSSGQPGAGAAARAPASGPYDEVPGSEQAWPAQLVLLAMGFLGPEPWLLAQFGVERDERGNIRSAQGAFATNVRGVFAAGDARRGQSLVVWAIKEGRGAARQVHRYLMGL
jgi:glutamate synthase (NADPH/NADH) small chain